MDAAAVASPGAGPPPTRCNFFVCIDAPLYSGPMFRSSSCTHRVVNTLTSFALEPKYLATTSLASPRLSFSQAAMKFPSQITLYGSRKPCAER